MLPTYSISMLSDVFDGRLLLMDLKRQRCQHKYPNTTPTIKIIGKGKINL